MSNTDNQVNLNLAAGISELDDVLASQHSGGLSLSVVAKSGESAAGAVTSDGRRAQAGNGEVQFEFDEDTTASSFTFPDIFGDFSFTLSA